MARNDSALKKRCRCANLFVMDCHGGIGGVTHWTVDSGTGCMKIPTAFGNFLEGVSDWQRRTEEEESDTYHTLELEHYCLLPTRQLSRRLFTEREKMELHSDRDFSVRCGIIRVAGILTAGGVGFPQPHSFSYLSVAP